MSFGHFPLMDAYAIDDDSEDDAAESSDDDLDIILHGTADQRRKLGRRSRGHRSSSSEDEFEKEMAAELNQTLNNIHKKQLSGVPSGDHHADNKGKAGPSNSRRGEETFLDSDSDDDDAETKDKTRTGPVLSNDDLLYDPQQDDDDQSWVDRQRRGYLGIRQTTAGSGTATRETRKGETKDGTKEKSLPRGTGVKLLPQSDAVLNCPGCMTLLTMDCQRHDKYHHQYRAMFVSNCTVDRTEVLRYPTVEVIASQQKNKRKKKNMAHKELRKNARMQHDKVNSDVSMDVNSDEVTRTECSQLTEGAVSEHSQLSEGAVSEHSHLSEGSANPLTDGSANGCDTRGTYLCGSKGYYGESESLDEVYHPVRCSVCNTEVGVYDQDEVYHFFNILSGYS